jgi:hypothetical protein
VLWGWVDQKNEATGLVRGALDAVSGRLARTGGLARHELVVAAQNRLTRVDGFLESLGFESVLPGSGFEDTDYLTFATTVPEFSQVAPTEWPFMAVYDEER